MRFYRCKLCWLFPFLIFLITALPLEAQGSDSKQIPPSIQQWLAQFNLDSPHELKPLASPAFAHLFPSCHFYSMHFRQYPVARQIPAPLHSSNILVADENGIVTPLLHINDLDHF